MTNTDWSQQRIRDIVTSHPVAAELFRANGIDFCCNGDRVLAEEVSELELTQKEIYLALDEIRENDGGATQGAAFFTDMDPRPLIDHIVTKHHAYLWENLPQIRALLTETLRANGMAHPELYDVYKLYGELTKELEPHLIREETEFVPLVGESEPGKCEKCRLLMHVLADDHKKAATIMKDIRRATNNYSVPAGADEGLKDLYTRLQDLEGNLYEYIHQENNILFPKIA